MKQAIENKYIVDWFITQHYTNIRNNLPILKSQFKIVWTGLLVERVCSCIVFVVEDENEIDYWQWWQWILILILEWITYNV